MPAPGNGTGGARRRAPLVPSLVLLAATLVGACGLLPGHSRDCVRFDSAGDALCGTLVLPEARQGPFPVAIFVHGDGALTHDAYGYYDAFRRALSDRGIASFSWDKPGVGASEGDWLAQDMNDRAREVVAAFRHLSRLEQVASDGIGLIGFSQAGWVLPRLAEREWVDYMVFVSTAIDWIEQGDYLRRRRLESPDGRDPPAGQARAAGPETPAPGGRIDELLLSANADYESYLRLVERVGDADERDAPMSEARFGFVRRNIDEDARRHLGDIRVPVLALFGADDLNVDVNDSVKVYRRAFGNGGQVEFDYRVFPDATHQLTRSRYFNTQRPGLLEVLKIGLLGDDVFADGVLDTLGDFVAAHSARRTDAAGSRTRRGRGVDEPSGSTNDRPGRETPRHGGSPPLR